MFWHNTTLNTDNSDTPKTLWEVLNVIWHRKICNKIFHEGFCKLWIAKTFCKFSETKLSWSLKVSTALPWNTLCKTKPYWSSANTWHLDLTRRYLEGPCLTTVFISSIQWLIAVFSLIFPDSGIACQMISGWQVLPSTRNNPTHPNIADKFVNGD